MKKMQYQSPVKTCRLVSGENGAEIAVIRQSSVAHKMRIRGGDTGAVKQDSGHATLQMLLKYADHSFDQHSKELLDRMEHSSFYGQILKQDAKKPPESPEANGRFNGNHRKEPRFTAKGS